MRKYQLVIGNSSDAGGQLILDVSSGNPQGCEIEFNIQQYSAGETVLAEITMYNISPYYFTMNQQLIKKPVWLYAGMENDTPILQKIGYTGVYGLIAQGYISRVIPEWNGNDTAISITFEPFLISESENNVNTTAYELNITTMNDMNDVRPKYYDMYKKIGGNIKTLNMGKLPVSTKTPYTQQIYTVAQLSATLFAQHGYTLNQTKDGFIISSEIGRTIVLAPGDFIVQPALTKFNEIALTLMMRSDIRMNDVIVLPQNIYVGITQLEKDVQTLASIFQQKTIFSLFHGQYLVTGVWQMGSVRNPEAQAWATTIQAVLYK